MDTKDQRALLNRYKVLTETSPDCIKLMDKKGKLLYINPGGVKEHRLESLENALKLGWKMKDSIVDEDLDKVQDAFNRAKNGEIVTIEVRHTRDGSDREVCMETMAPVINDKGDVEAVFGVSRDITKIKKVEEELIRVKNSLEDEVQNRTQQLERKVKDMERINDVLVGRELDMVRLKKENEELRSKLDDLVNEK